MSKIVFMSPDYRITNPYQGLLQKELELMGIDVYFFSLMRPILCLKTIKNTREAAFHFHWLQLIDSSAFQTFLKFVILCGQLLLLRLLGCRLVWTIHDLDRHESKYLKLERLFNIIFAQLMSSLIVHNRFAVEVISKAYKTQPKKIHAVPHGGFENVYLPAVSSQKAREYLNLPSDKNIFFAHGLLRPYKGLEELMQMWSCIAGSGDLLLIVGKGHASYAPYAVFLSEIAKKYSNVCIRNRFVPDDEMHLYYSAVDAVIFSYKKIFTSGAFYLASTYHKPLLAPRNAFFQEILADYPQFIYEQNDLTDLKRALGCVKEMLVEKKSMIISNVTWKTIANLTARVYGFEE